MKSEVRQPVVSGRQGSTHAQWRSRREQAAVRRGAERARQCGLVARRSPSDPAITVRDTPIATRALMSLFFKFRSGVSTLSPPSPQPIAILVNYYNLCD
ncbi:unnamed protein product [Arctia plantaginis]|uniref:Uncharacterized protein n=1 Tax=Arctia plantaginis TaxID=874455 RepID=A0A8S1AMD8_ARCPL|nr:unnamed protein product [Arctia plantaginis]